MAFSKLKNSLRETIIYTAYSFVKYKIYPIKLRKAGINSEKPKVRAVQESLLDGKKVIISLTSFPERIPLIYKGLYSLMNQEYKPNRIILWLSKDQFPGEEERIPNEVLELKRYGLEIRWLDGDIRSYKKLIPALKEFPNDIIVTVDDDIYYPSNWLKNLIDAYMIDPYTIHCHLITRLAIRDGCICSTKRDKKMLDSTSYFNKILGAGGVLYPPKSMDETVLNQSKFLSIAPTSDDIWFWAMALKNETKIHWLSNSMRKLYYIENSQESTPCLTNINDQGERLFDKHMNAVANEYNLLEILQNEGYTEKQESLLL